MGWERAVLLGTALLLPQICAADSLSVLINEVLYDPEGKDTGWEFIELHNRSYEAICLDGHEVLTGNGAQPEKWTAEWHGSAADTIPAHGFFLIGEEQVIPAPDFITPLDLQNGPDACLLILPDSRTDRVGWGPHDFKEYYEGLPADEVSSGSSLGRDPDGKDTDDNSMDFAAFPVPTPGDFNRPPCDLALVKACLSRYSQPNHSTTQLIVLASNLGTQPCGAGAKLTVVCSGLADTSHLARDLAPVAEERLAISLPNPGPGLHDITIWHSHAADRMQFNDTLSTSILIPPAPLVINEIMFKPDRNECEWVELLNRSTCSLHLSGWTLEDSGAKRRQIRNDGLSLAAGQYLLLVQDEEVLRLSYEGVDCVVIEPDGGWPTLNDTDGPRGYADMLVLRDAFGTCVDSVAYRSAWGEPGFSIERIDPDGRSALASNWSPHYGREGGSPGAANSVSFALPGPGGYLSLSPRTFSPDGDGTEDMLAVCVDMPGAAVVRLKVFDINGRPLVTLLDGDLVEERRVTFWDGRVDGGKPAPVGVYIVLLEAKPVAGGRTVRSRLPVVLVRK